MALLGRNENTLPDCSSTKKTKSMFDSFSLIDQLLPVEILNSIFHKLDYTDLVQCRAVSSKWNSLVEDLLAYPIPFLMFPSKGKGKGDVNCFFRLGDGQISNLEIVPKEFRESLCVGSSNGWLVFLEDHAVPFVFHPFKQVKFQLPSLLSVLGLERLERNTEGDYDVVYSGIFSRCTKQILKKNLIRKLVLKGDPDGSNENFGVAMLCNHWRTQGLCQADPVCNYGLRGDGRLACYWSGESLWSWRSCAYKDIIWRGNHLYGLKALKEEGTNIEVWGWKGNYMSMVKNLVVHLPPTVNLENHFRISRFYLIESCGDILLAVRFVRNPYYCHVGETRVDTNFNSLLKPNTSRYRAYLFQVYKLDTNYNQWMEMKPLDDRVLFLSGNQSVSVSSQSLSNCEINSIYYIHEMGIYNFKDGNEKIICKFSTAKRPLYWIIPNVKRHDSMRGICS